MLSEAIQNSDIPLRKVGKYRILSELGRGGMANVYLAVTHSLGGINKLVVLKALLPEVAAEPDALTMFLEEARLAAQLNHGNVVQTYEVGIEGGRHVIVMEYLEGQALSSILRRAEVSGQPLPVAMHLRIISSVLEGLHYAHELSAYDGSPLTLVHRDVSPQNVFVTYGGQVKVLDFGIAKASSSSSNTATGVLKGKLAYMAPEQMVAEGIDRRADVYSVGCMLWALAAGKKLWRDASDVHIMRAVLNDEIPSPQSVNPKCDYELNRIVMKALACDPEQRYQSALDLQDDVERYCEVLAIPNRQKEIGQYVAGLFSASRAELKALVERQLVLVASHSARFPPGPGVAADGAEGTSQALGSGSFPDGTGLSSTTDKFMGEWLGIHENDRSYRGRSPVDVQTARDKKRKVWAIAGALSLLLVGLGFGATLSSRPRSTELGEASRPGEIAVSVATSKAPPAPAQASLELRASPAVAVLILDGERLDANPATRRLAIDGSEHQLRAEAEGYRASVRSFVAARDEVIDIRLEKLAPVGQPDRVPRDTTHKPAAAPKPSTKPRPAVDCAQPFFVDSDGIKKIRLACL